MDARLAIALAIHAGACRLMVDKCTAPIAVDASRAAMRLVIPDFDDISFDLVYLLEPTKTPLRVAYEASERLRRINAKADQ